MAFELEFEAVARGTNSWMKVTRKRMRQMKRGMESTWMKIEHVYFFANFTLVVDRVGGKVSFVKN